MEKKRIKIFKVDECFQCPHILSGINYETEQKDFDCGKIDREVTNPYIVPKWCPLEDYKG